MSDHRRLRQLGIALALVGALGLAAARPAVAQTPRSRGSRLALAQPGLLARAWSWLVVFAASWAGMDPDGSPAPGATTDSWGGIDPNGSPVTATTGYSWAGMDPNGSSATAPPPATATTDNWTGIDPNG
jgi:hypothetical protein